MTLALMFPGTSSDCGKSIMTAAFCRLRMRNGIRVAPFKSHNMAVMHALGMKSCLPLNFIAKMAQFGLYNCRIVPYRAYKTTANSKN